MQKPPRDQQKRVPAAIATEQGRRALIEQWKHQCDIEGSISQEQESPSRFQQQSSCAEWLRWCIAQQLLDPTKRLPPYAQLGEPFSLSPRHVARVIVQLRSERLLPERKTRIDKDKVVSTEREQRMWSYTGHMRALRFDQVRRLLARWSPQPHKTMLSVSRSSEIVKRWTATGIRRATYYRVYNAQPGWVSLTARGLRAAGLPFRAERPSSRLLEHLYWITEVRMRLEEEQPSIEWISERSILSQYKQRHEGQRLPHIPDGVIVLKDEHGITQHIDIEVQISKPSPKEVREAIRYQSWGDGNNYPVRYYVNRLSRGVVQSTYQKMRVEAEAMRPAIEIIDLAEWLHNPDVNEQW